MKPFVLEKSMLTMRGVFYPTGHVVLMVPSQEDAKNACKALHEHGVSPDDMSLLPPDVLMGDIAHTVGSADSPMPSVGTEADTVRKLVALAADGHWGLLVHAPHAKDSDSMVEWLRGVPVVYAQKYRHLVIEDIVG
ncbi:MAG: hypothetical protein V4609_07400 [Pseudomonadota bacterium]